jgi:putative ABC transport system permease protein
MRALETLAMALRALLRNKTRSFLTVLGVVIGVGAVIAMVAIGEGAKAKVEETFASMGSGMLIVTSGSSRTGGMQMGFGSMPTLTWEDLKAIRTELPAVRYAAPATRLTAEVIGSEQNWTTSVSGTSPEFFSIRSWPAARGALFTDSDVDTGAKVVVLGQTVVDKLFGAGVDPTGQAVRIRSIPFLVAGVLTRKGQSPMGSDYDDAVFVPISTFRAKLQGGLGNFIPGAILVGAAAPDQTSRAERQIAGLLRDRHKLKPGVEDDFAIRNLTEMANAQQQGTRTLTMLLAAIAAVSLLVGGIGIMNIMLVSVTERTHEIGLRMAVGAKSRNILTQFLIEAMTLSLIGGLLGAALGGFAAERMAARFGWPLSLRPDVMLIAVGFSALVGIVFGLYPARKASRLDPIDALRYE